MWICRRRCGILWVRNLLKSLAAEGRIVFVSSHLVNEVAITASELIVIGRGRLIASGSVQDVIRGATAAPSWFAPRRRND